MRNSKLAKYTVYRARSYNLNVIDAISTLARDINSLEDDSNVYFEEGDDAIKDPIFRDFIFTRYEVLSFDKQKLEELIILYGLLGGELNVPRVPWQEYDDCLVEVRMPMLREAAKLMYEI